MRGRLLLLNLLLLAGIGGAVWQLRQNWLAGRQRETELLRKSLPPLPAPAILVAPPPGVVNSTPYLEVASRLLMSRDRNPNVVIEEVPQKPMPALPKFYGILGFDDKPFIIMAERSGAPQKKVQVGERIGEFTVVKLETTGITFEWEGKKVASGFAELADRAPVQMPQGAPTSPSDASSSSTAIASTTSIASPAAARPGSEVAPNTKACVSGDSSPDGTIADGYRKIVNRTPFGNQCRWELVR